MALSQPLYNSTALLEITGNNGYIIVCPKGVEVKLGVFKITPTCNSGKQCDRNKRKGIEKAYPDHNLSYSNGWIAKNVTLKGTRCVRLVLGKNGNCDYRVTLYADKEMVFDSKLLTKDSSLESKLA